MSKSRGVLIVLVIAAALWALTISDWQAGAVSDTLGPTGVAEVTDDSSSKASPVATACVAIIAVTGLLAAMLGKVGRFVVLGLAAVAALGYGITALTTAAAPGATSWAIIAAVASGIGVIGIIWVASSSARWTNSNRYARSAEAADGEFDSAAAWDALSRGEDIPGEPEGKPVDEHQPDEQARPGEPQTSEHADNAADADDAEDDEDVEDADSREAAEDVEEADPETGTGAAADGADPESK